MASENVKRGMIQVTSCTQLYVDRKKRVYNPVPEDIKDFLSYICNFWMNSKPLSSWLRYTCCQRKDNLVRFCVVVWTPMVLNDRQIWQLDGRWLNHSPFSRVNGQWLNKRFNTSTPPPAIQEGICLAGHVENLWNQDQYREESSGSECESNRAMRRITAFSRRETTSFWCEALSA